MKSWSLIAFMSAWALTACQGQDPTRRESNPVKDYPAVTDPSTVKPYVPGKVEAQPEDPDNTQRVCFEPYKVSIDGDQGNKLLTFVEKESRTYKIKIRSFIDDAFSVQASTLSGANFHETSRSGNTAEFDFTWEPPKGSSKEVRIEGLTLKFFGSVTESLCGRGMSEVINIVVVKTEVQPTVQFQSIPQSPVVFGDDLNFQVLVQDPAGSSEFGPKLLPIEFRAIARSGEKTVLDASKAVTCTEAGTQLSESQWSFDCKLESKKIDGVSSHMNRDRIVDAAVFVTAKSQRNSRSSAPTPLYVPVHFQKAVSASAKTGGS